MSDNQFDEFKKCVKDKLSYDAEAWDELVIKPLIEFGKWFRQQDPVIEGLLGGVATIGVTAISKWLGRMFAISEAEVLALIIVALGVGGAIGESINLIMQCGEDLIPRDLYNSWEPPTAIIW